MDFKRLEIQLLKYWLKNNVRYIYKHKNAIKWSRGRLTHFTLITDIGVNKLFKELENIMNVDQEPSIDEVKRSVEDLLEIRLNGEKVEYQPATLQKDLLDFWNMYNVYYVSKYKHTINEYYAGSSRHLFFDISSGDFFPMVVDTASLAQNSPYSTEDLKVAVADLKKRDLSDFKIDPSPEKENVPIKVIYSDSREEVVTVSVFNKENAMEHFLNTCPKQKLKEIAIIQLIK